MKVLIVVNHYFQCFAALRPLLHERAFVEVMRPLDAKLPGKPFELDLLAFPFTPLVLVVGNHSAGKSTFINQLLGLQVQETGVLGVVSPHLPVGKNSLRSCPLWPA